MAPLEQLEGDTWPHCVHPIAKTCSWQRTLSGAVSPWETKRIITEGDPMKKPTHRCCWSWCKLLLLSSSSCCKPRARGCVCACSSWAPPGCTKHFPERVPARTKSWAAKAPTFLQQGAWKPAELRLYVVEIRAAQLASANWFQTQEAQVTPEAAARAQVQLMLVIAAQRSLANSLGNRGKLQCFTTSCN